MPPAISGGTLLVMKDGHTAVAADSDRDRVWVVDLDQQAVLHEIVLQVHDEPGRVVEDGAGRVHVALRRGGALVSIDPQAGTILARRPVCPAPRGVGYDANALAVHVACADGRLVTFPAAGGPASRSIVVDGDLRDVVWDGTDLYVTRFRSAEILRLDGAGVIQERITLPVAPSLLPGPMGPATAAPSVAWRAVPLPGGGIAVLHQRAQVEPLSTMPGAYTSMGPCPGAGIVHDAVSVVHAGATPTIVPPLGMVSLAVDLAVSPDGLDVAIAAPGTLLGSPVTTLPLSMTQEPGPCAMPGLTGSTLGQATAVAYTGEGALVVQIREPAGILVPTRGITVSLPAGSVANEGHALFHMATKGASIACASCHPEAGDDGRVWSFSGLGLRRTQNLRGGVLARAPFHWSGDIADMDALVTQVLVGRMGGGTPTASQTVALGQWMDGQPALGAPPPADPTAVARGHQIFADPTVGCVACHNGAQLSDHALVDVGTGGIFKVPSLVDVGYRAPFLHDGCAATLRDRFTSPSCGTPDAHAHTSQLTSSQIDDLVAYLQSL